MDKENINKLTLNSKGITLVELVAILVILGIIAGISFFTIGSIFNNVREDVQVINMQNIHTYIDDLIALESPDAESLFTYKRSGSADETYFSIFLETTWEVKNGPGDEDNTNVLNMTNSLSEKYGVVNWSDAPALGNNLYCNQALYITTDSDASYEIDNPKTIDTCYAGSIVIWYDSNNADNIIIYFVNNDSVQTDMYFIYHKEDFLD